MGKASPSEKTDRILNRIRSNLEEKATASLGVRAMQQLHSKRMQALELFRPFPYQDEFLLCDSTEVLVRGGTRSGKSSIIAAAITAYVTNQPIYTSFGGKIYPREEHYRDKPTGEIWVIGKQISHSSTIYRLLFQRGAFQILKDPKTGQWRAWRPGIIPGDDKIPKNQLKPAPPFIDPRTVEFGWNAQREKTWHTATLPNGWVIKYWPSNGEPKRGDPVHRIWIDEEVLNDVDLYAELQSRLSDYGGRIWWSSWPDLDCPALVELYDRAVQEMEDHRAGNIDKCDVYQMAFVGSANPVIDEEEKRKRARGWDSATRAARDLGEFNRETLLSYPEFSANTHTVDYGPTSHLNDKLTMCLRANNYVPPLNWCVYLILDPGTVKPGLLWVAIPPEDFWYKGKPFYVPYHEITGRFHAGQLATMAKFAEPRRVYQRFIIDGKAGDQTPMGFTEQEKVRLNYARAFTAAGLQAVETPGTFQRGEMTWIVRAMALKNMMLPIGADTSLPQLRIVQHKCPNLVTQIRRNLRHVTKQDVQDKQASGQVKDLLDCLEYFAGSQPRFAVPPPPQIEETPQFRHYTQEQARWDSLVVSRKSPNSRGIVCGIP